METTTTSDKWQCNMCGDEFSGMMDGLGIYNPLCNDCDLIHDKMYRNMVSGFAELVNAKRDLDACSRVISYFFPEMVENRLAGPTWILLEEIFGEMMARKALSGVLRDRDAIEEWLVTGNNAFDGRLPIDMIKDGEWERIVEMCDMIGQGAFI